MKEKYRPVLLEKKRHSRLTKSIIRKHSMDSDIRQKNLTAQMSEADLQKDFIAQTSLHTIDNANLNSSGATKEEGHARERSINRSKRARDTKKQRPSDEIG